MRTKLRKIRQRLGREEEEDAFDPRISGVRRDLIYSERHWPYLIYANRPAIKYININAFPDLDDEHDVFEKWYVYVFR